MQLYTRKQHSDIENMQSVAIKIYFTLLRNYKFGIKTYLTIWRRK